MPIYTTNTNNAANASDNARLLQLPAYILADPALWFSLVEEHFIITETLCDYKKYALIVTSLPNLQISEIRDFLVNSPSADKYKAIKNEVMSKFLEKENNDYLKPSQFLWHLKKLAGNAVSQDRLQTLWIRSLPRDVQEILSTKVGCDLGKLADIADVLAEELTSTQVAPTPGSELSSSMRQMYDLQKKMKSMSVEMKRHWSTSLMFRCWEEVCSQPLTATKKSKIKRVQRNIYVKSFPVLSASDLQ